MAAKDFPGSTRKITHCSGGWGGAGQVRVTVLPLSLGVSTALRGNPNAGVVEAPRTSTRIQAANFFTPKRFLLGCTGDAFEADGRPAIACCQASSGSRLDHFDVGPGQKGTRP